MCQYNYFFFETCKHFGIEVAGCCAPAHWQGGMSGSLTLCRPALLNRRVDYSGLTPYEHPMDMQWDGIEGHCRECVDEFMLPPTVYQRSYTPHRLPEAQDVTLFDPAELAPYLYMPILIMSIPDLIGLGEEYTKNCNARRSPVPRIVFPTRLERSDWETLRTRLPWQSKGMWEIDGPAYLTLGQAHAELGLSMGFTGEDGELIHQSIIGVAEQMMPLYNRHFRLRGMPPKHFMDAYNKLTAQNGWATQGPFGAPGWLAAMPYFE